MRSRMKQSNFDTVDLSFKAVGGLPNKRRSKLNKNEMLK